MTSEYPPVSRFQWLGGHVCLDFVNTVNDRVRPPKREYIGRFAQLVDWFAAAGLLTPSAAADLARLAERQPEMAAQTVAEAHDLRETLYRLFASRIRGEAPPPDDLSRLNAWLAESAPARVLAERDGVYEWAWRTDPAAKAMMWPLVWAAADLLTDPNLARVKECPAPDGCGWLFLDHSKNRSRRWCSMKNCGNAAKARRHYRRKKRAQT